ncbi:MAG: peptidyl-prolyl cis-trans isomerase [Vicinamibacterales bacterium]
MTMLDRMRRHRSWLKWSLALVVLTFIAFYARDFADTNNTAAATAIANPNSLVAEVDGREITVNEFTTRYQNQIQAYRNAYGAGVSDQLIRQLGLDQQILQQMVDEQAALAEAQRQGITVSDEELAQQIFSIPGLQENGRFIGEQRYEQLLRSQRPPMTKAQFEDGLRQSMMLDKLRAAITDWMAVSDQELEREFRLRNEKVKLQVVALTADKFRDQVTVNDTELITYFNDHKAEYRKGEQRTVRYFLLDRDALRAKTTIAPADIQQYYNANIAQYQTPEQIRASHILLNTEGKDKATVRTQAEDILKQVKAPGADFAALAKKYSEDEGSKVNGGDLDFFARGRMVAEFENAAFAMQPGQISDLVETQFGFHIIKMVDKKAATTRTLDELRAQIQETLALQRVDQQVETKTRELDARISNATDLATVANENGTTVQESGFFAREDPVPGLGSAPQVVASAFQLADNAVSKAITSPRGPVWITVSGKKDPYVPALDEVKERVREDVVRTKAREISRQRATAIAASLRSAKDFAAAAKAQGFEAKDTELLTREAAIPDVGISPEVDKAAFALPVGGVSEPIVTSDAAVIVRVAQREDVTPAKLNESKDTFREQLLSERRNQFFASYLSKAKQNMKIEIFTDVARRATGT